eukprot:6723963-Pyramimonas_sp.AAC.1
MILGFLAEAILDAPTRRGTPRRRPEEGVGGGVKPSPRKFPKPPTPRGLVGFRAALCPSPRSPPSLPCAS